LPDYYLGGENAESSSGSSGSAFTGAVDDRGSSGNDKSSSGNAKSSALGLNWLLVVMALNKKKPRLARLILQLLPMTGEHILPV